MRALIGRMRPSDREVGLSLIELMMALLVFGLAATGIAAGFISAIKTGGNDRSRLAATNLAQRELEIVRNTFNSSVTGPQTVVSEGDATNPHPLAGGVAGQPLQVDGRAYTVKRVVRWHTGNTGASDCDGSSSVNYPKLFVDIYVTWPGMTSNMTPVESHTILTPPRTVINSTTSYVAVKVTNAAGGPNTVRTVGLKQTSTGTMMTATTGSDGCAVFSVSATGAFTVILNEDGYVGASNVQLVSKAINITASSFQNLTLSYDQEANLVTQLTTDTGYSVPAGVTTVTLAATTFALGSAPYAATSTGPTTITDLWPITSGYASWAGSCAQSDPATAGGSRTSTVIAPGTTSSLIPARLTPIDITVQNATTDAPIAGTPVRAVPASTSKCTSGEADLLLGTTDATGHLKTSLPAGKWKVRASAFTTSGWVWPSTATLLPTSLPQTLEVDTP